MRSSVRDYALGIAKVMRPMHVCFKVLCVKSLGEVECCKKYYALTSKTLEGTKESKLYKILFFVCIGKVVMG